MEAIGKERRWTGNKVERHPEHQREPEPDRRCGAHQSNKALPYIKGLMSSRWAGESFPPNAVTSERFQDRIPVIPDHESSGGGVIVTA